MLFCMASLMMPAALSAQHRAIVTAAGGGSLIHDNVPATQAVVPNPRAVAADGNGNLYIATDYYVFKVDAAGMLTILAGTTDPYLPWSDGGPATATPVGPLDIAADQAGNVYIVETHRVRKVDASTGVIHTVAGTGEEGFSGDGGLATLAKLSFTVWEIHLYTGGVAVDAAGNLFIADAGNNRIRRVDAVTQEITTVAGNGTYGYSGDGGPATSAALKAPTAVAVDAAGILYIADRENLRVRRVANNIIITYAGTGEWYMCSAGPSGDGGPATSAPIQMPGDVVSDAAGHVLIADGCGYGVWLVDPTTKIITRVAGGGGPYGGDGGPAIGAGVSVKDLGYGAGGRFYIADFVNNRVRLVDGGVISTVAGNGGGYTTYAGDGGLATEGILQLDDGSGGFGSRSAVAVDSLGNLYLSDTLNWAVRRVDAQTSVITTVAAGKLPSGLALDAADRLYIADTYNQVIRRFDPASGTLTVFAGNGNPTRDSGPNPEPFKDGVPATSTSLCYPSGVAVDAAGNIYIADTLNSRIRKVDATGYINTIVGNGTRGFGGDGGPATQASLNDPHAVVVMQDGTLYVADTENSRVRRVSPDGTIATVAAVTKPIGLTASASGVLYIAAAATHRVYRYDPATPTVPLAIVAGTGIEGFSGDGGPAWLAALHSPTDVAVAPDGTIYVADSGNHRIRALPPDVLPPAITVPSDMVVEATSASGRSVSFTVSAADNIDPAPAVVCTPASGSQFAVGTTTVTCTATDSNGNSASGSFKVGVVDTTGPTITGITASPSTIWPPNRSLQEVTLTVAVSDLVDPRPTCRAVSVTCNDPSAKAGDAVITGGLLVVLRADRTPHFKDRVYAVTVGCRDQSMNVATRVAAIPVVNRIK
jgi:sugar lactone lactonase YvrE